MLVPNIDVIVRLLILCFCKCSLCEINVIFGVDIDIYFTCSSIAFLQWKSYPIIVLWCLVFYMLQDTVVRSIGVLCLVASSLWEQSSHLACHGPLTSWFHLLRLQAIRRIQTILLPGCSHVLHLLISSRLLPHTIRYISWLKSFVNARAFYSLYERLGCYMFFHHC